ncbi:hypothetical protein AVEN_27475-1 [Araneus ventricosus]|uniref:Uncharacterized protein n=1 Tax=Araneus ventricosus TaxID=182803 RepID=A0A4Y2WLH3_ARAVE|nr:hypothetical protein AVEN_27475-1 [Araneus ventricosus]
MVQNGKENNGSRGTGRIGNMVQRNGKIGTWSIDRTLHCSLEQFILQSLLRKLCTRSNLCVASPRTKNLSESCNPVNPLPCPLQPHVRKSDQSPQTNLDGNICPGSPDNVRVRLIPAPPIKSLKTLLQIKIQILVTRES